MKSKYYERLQNMLTQASDSLEIIGDLIVVERLPEPEQRTVGGILVQDSGHARSNFGADTRPHFALVVAVGKGYYDDSTGEAISLNAKPGDVVLIASASVKYFSSFGDMLNYEPDTLGITRESEIQMRFKGPDGYTKAFEMLNGKDKKTV